jgi:hypothetical protein
MEKYMKRIMLFVAVILSALAMTGCTVSTPSDGTLVHKGGGIIEAADPKGCVSSASRELEKPGDGYYLYHTNQRTYAFDTSYDANAAKEDGYVGPDGPAIGVISKDGQPLTISGTVTFNLNTDCDVLQRFHDQVGNKEHAYFDDTDRTPVGFRTVLNKYMRPSLDATLDRIAKQYDWRQLYSDVSIKDAMNTEVNAKIASLVNDRFQGKDEFFVNFSALILQPAADNDLVGTVKATELSKAQAQATETKAKADAAAAEAAAKAQVAQKNAELTVAQKEAAIQAARVAPYGSIKNWLDAQAIEKGLNPFQPTYGAGANVLAPSK